MVLLLLIMKVSIRVGWWVKILLQESMKQESKPKKKDTDLTVNLTVFW
jgi:hypothetical protein